MATEDAAVAQLPPAAGPAPPAVDPVLGRPRCFALRDRPPGKTRPRSLREGDVLQRITRVAPSHGRRARSCYDALLARRVDSPPEGRVTVRFVIEPDGSVREACATDASIADETFTTCVVRSVLGVDFDVPADGGRVEVSYPFHFEREE